MFCKQPQCPTLGPGQEDQLLEQTRGFTEALLPPQGFPNFHLLRNMSYLPYLQINHLDDVLDAPPSILKTYNRGEVYMTGVKGSGELLLKKIPQDL